MKDMCQLLGPHRLRPAGALTPVIRGASLLHALRASYLLIDSFTQRILLQSYHHESTPSHQNSEVKRGWARLVLGSHKSLTPACRASPWRGLNPGIRGASLLHALQASYLFYLFTQRIMCKAVPRPARINKGVKGNLQHRCRRLGRLPLCSRTVSTSRACQVQQTWQAAVLYCSTRTPPSLQTFYSTMFALFCQFLDLVAQQFRDSPSG
eukprot:jgi/Chrzof1/7357/Cz02g20250.t1